MPHRIVNIGMSNAPPDASTQQLLTAVLQATAEMQQLNLQQNQKLDQHSQRLDQQNQKLDQHSQRLDQQNQKLDHLAEQVGHLTEGLTEIKLLVQEQSETSKRQERNIERLVGIVDKLIHDHA